MELSEAVQLIQHGVNTNSQRWADLGAGSGLFSRAIAELLSKPSVIYQVDKNFLPTHLGQQHSVFNLISGDFTNLSVVPRDLDGIIMANALHYVQEKESFLNAVKSKLVQGGKVIIVEYDMARGNPWVPFPVTLDALVSILQRAGYKTPTLIGEYPSKLNASRMVAVSAER